MNGRGVIAGLSLLFALVFCAFAAPSALGAKLNTTGVTCKAVEKGAQFSDEHCTKAKGEGKGFAHEAIPVQKETSVSFSNSKTAEETKSSTNTVLRFEAAETEFEVVCTSVSGGGFMENRERENEKKEKEMLVTMKVEPTYSGCAVPVPAKQECKVASESFSPFSQVTSYEKKMGIEFSKTQGPITIEKCSTESLNGKYTFDGSIRAEPNGVTLNTGAATAATLLVNKKPAELISSVTLRARLSALEETTPLSFTTG